MTVIEHRQSEKRRLILQAARGCFVRHGFHSTGMAELCRAAGMSPGNLYRYFPSKASIILAMVDEAREQALQEYERLEETADPREAIVRILLRCVRQLSDSDESRLWIEILAEASRNDEIRQSCLLFDRELCGTLRRFLDAGMETGRIALQADVEGTILNLMALIDGAIVRAATDPGANMKAYGTAFEQNVRRLLSASAEERKKS